MVRTSKNRLDPEPQQLKTELSVCNTYRFYGCLRDDFARVTSEISLIYFYNL
jgi:hypothetical protein